MVRPRLLALGLVVLACGWQAVLGETAPDAARWGAASVVGGAALAGFAVPTWSARAGLAVGLLAISALGAETAAHLMAVLKAVPGSATVTAAALSILGVDAVATGGHTLVHASNQALDWFPGTARLSGFVVLTVGLCLAGTAALLPLRRRGRVLSVWLAWLLAYALVRIVAVGAARLDLPGQGLDTSTVWLLLTWLPWIAFAPFCALEAPAVAGGEARGLRLAAALALGAFWAVGLGAEDPGAAKSGRVLFDDSHGIWEPTTLPFDTHDFSRRTSYSYSDMFDLIGRRFQIERWSEGPLTAEVLSKADVLILKTPTRRFQPGEIDAIEGWVAAGGGLYLIGDHTDLFGMSTYLNEVSRRFDITFRDDDTYDLASEGTSTWRAPNWLAHPIAGKVKAFEFETTCTLDVPLTARLPVRGYALGTDQADYSNPGFFGNIQLDASDDYGFFPQLATLSYGSGRVAAISDSTPFSNFSLYFPGRPEMVLATVAFLDRSATVLRHLPWVGLLGATFSFLLLLVAPATGLGGVAWQAGAVLLGAAAASSAAAAVNASLPMPPVHGFARRVAIDRAVSGGEYPDGLYTDPRFELAGFDSLILAVQRLAYVPNLSSDLADELSASDALVLLHPRRGLSPSERDRLIRFVTAGGGLLVVDGMFEPGTATNEILQPFGLAVGHDNVSVEVDEAVPVRDAPKRRILRPALVASGGFPVLSDPDGRAVYAEQDVGAGRVGVLVDSAGVARAGLGNRFYANISDDQKQYYETLFFILRRIVEERDRK